MLVIHNNHNPEAPRTVYCGYCYSELQIIKADLKHEDGRDTVKCPCCGRHFNVLTPAQLTQAYYNK